MSGPDDQEIVGVGEYQPRSREAVNGVASTASESGNGLGATSAGGESGLPHAARRKRLHHYLTRYAHAWERQKVDECKKYCAAILAEFDALGEDAERLDWLEGSASTLHCNYSGGDEGYTVTFHNFVDGVAEPHHGPTVRDAIDKARAS